MSVWISRLKVYRFGAFQDRSLPDFQPGLNLLYGPNESGKTTLMTFLRAMLFGFEGRGRSPYDPLDGGEPGGSLTLKDDQGQEWLIERWGRGRKAKVTVSGPGGLVPGEVGLANLIQNVNRAVYENIFAFGLAELADLKTLNQQGVKELLYSASLGLGQVSLAGVQGELKEQNKKLFNPDKRAKSEIRLLLDELEKVRQDLGRLEGQPQEYQELCQELEGVLQEIAGLEGKARQAEEKLLWLKKLSQAWPVWESWHLTRADLEALPQIEDFPEDGLGRLESIKAGLAQVEEHLGELLPELAESRRVVTALAPNEKLLESAAAIEALWEERVLFEDRREELGRREKELAAGQAHLTEALAQLGTGWDEERLANFNLSLSWRQDGIEWRERLGEARQVVGQAEERLNYCQAALREKEAVLERAVSPDQTAGAGWFFRWGLTTLGLFLGLAAGLGYFLAARPMAAWLAMGAGAVLAAAWLNFLQRRASHRQQLSGLEAEKQRADAALAAAQDALEQSRANLEHLQEEWRARLPEGALPATLTPEAVLELLQGIERLKENLENLQETRRACQSLGKYLDDFASRLVKLHLPLGRSPVSREEINDTLILLKEELDEARKIQEEQQRLAQKAASLEKEAARWQRDGERLEKDREHLLAAAGVEEEETFRQRAELYQRRRELLHRSREITVQMGLVAGGEEELKRLQEDLAKTTREDLQGQLGQAQGVLGELTAQLARLREEKGKLADRRQKLERTEELSQALLREQTLATRLGEAAWRWAIGTLSGRFLEQGRRRFEAEYQPQVFQQAGHYFARLTKGGYLKVMAPLEGEKFFVINRQGHHTPVERLSRGTVEQLYLALRFALIQAYSQGGRNLPLILDDILVNFDEPRARQAVRLFQEMSLSHQVLLFTCHPHLVNLVQDVLGPEAPTPIHLEEGEEPGGP